METFKIQNVEIFSVGKWNGDDYTKEDLQTIVESYNETKDGIPPFLKLGHNGDQKLAKQFGSEGKPAIGWVENLRVQGDKLVADFTDVPKKIYELIQKRAYRKVSSELFINLKTKEKTFKKVLGAVALLGAETPGVYNLADIMKMYAQAGEEAELKIYNESAQDITVESLNFNQGDKMTKTEAEIKLELELKAKNEEAAKLEEANKKFAADAQAQTQELADLKEFKAKAEKEKQELLQAAETARIEKFVTGLKADKLCTPAMEPLVQQLLGPEKKEYTVKIEDKDQNLSKQDLLKQTLNLFKAANDVNFDENSQSGKKDFKKDEADLDKAAKEFAAKNNVTYGQAMKVVLKENKNK